MREHLGEEFAGVVSSVTSFGLFVTLDAMYVEGLVHITELGGEYFRFDEHRQELRGERTGIRYHLGSRVQVQVSRVDLDGRRIDFRLVQPEGETTLRTSAGKGTPSEGGERVKARSASASGKQRPRPTNSLDSTLPAGSSRPRKSNGKGETRGKGKKPRR
jgi:ribonuclease R